MSFGIILNPHVKARAVLSLAITAGALTVVCYLLLKPRKKKTDWKIPLALPEKESSLFGHALFLEDLGSLQTLCVDGATEDGVARFHVKRCNLIPKSRTYQSCAHYL